MLIILGGKNRINDTRTEDAVNPRAVYSCNNLIQKKVICPASSSEHINLEEMQVSDKKAKEPDTIAKNGYFDNGWFD